MTNAKSPELDMAALNPPDWPKFTNEQISQFAESVTTVLSFRIFPPSLADQLSNYRYAANAVLRDRVRGGRE